jgi:pimeloyl-ACP methyl ester carboxylesterase
MGPIDGVDRPGAGTVTPTLVLVHGLGATRGVWNGVEAELAWPGRVVSPDLPGHGRAPWSGDYTVGALAAAVAAQLEPDEPVLIIGHSLGGAVGLCLASGFFRPVVRAVVGLGIKVAWTDDDVAQMGAVARRGIRWFDSRDEAEARFCRQSGLEGLIGADHPALDGAVVEGTGDDQGRWRVSQDPMTFAQRPMDMAGLMAAARATGTSVVLGAGEHDAMVSAADLAAHVDEPRIATGRGHNVHVEDPAWVATLVEASRGGGRESR